MVKAQSTQPILLVEDSPEDYAVIARVFKKIHLLNPVYRCSDGDEALDYLFQRGPFAHPETAPCPGIILLDLNLPGTDGRDILTQIKRTPELKKIPVVVLTTSADQRDIDACYEAGANSYVQKPVTVSEFFAAIQRLSEFWFEIALLPKGEAG